MHRRAVAGGRGMRGGGGFQRSALAAALTLLVAGCAQQAPPTGGPPDLTPPVIVRSIPDSGQVNVPRGSTLRVAFSKRMDRRSVEDYVFTSPPIRFARVNWSGGHELELTPQDS